MPTFGVVIFNKSTSCTVFDVQLCYWYLYIVTHTLSSRLMNRLGELGCTLHYVTYGVHA